MSGERDTHKSPPRFLEAISILGTGGAAEESVGYKSWQGRRCIKVYTKTRLKRLKKRDDVGTRRQRRSEYIRQRRRRGVLNKAEEYPCQLLEKNH